MRKIGIGLVGYGFMGKTHSYAYKTLPLYYQNLPFQAELAGVCSRRLENAAGAARDLGYAFATDDFQKLLEHPGIDVIDICTPNNLHHSMVLAAAAAGKDIYCDKPLAVNEQQAGEMCDAVRSRKIINQVAFNNRFLPATMRARELIDQGRLGRIMTFRAAYLHAGSVDPEKPISWKLDQEISGGGVLLDLGSHILDLVSFLLGPYSRLLARTQRAYPQRPDSQGKMVNIVNEDAVYLLAEMADGSMGTLEASKIATGSQDELRLEIHGECGALRFNLMDPNWLYFYDNTLPEQALGGDRGYTQIECVQRYPGPGGAFPAPKASLGWLRGHVHSLYHFLDCVAREKPASPSFADAAYIQKIMARAYQSAQSGQWVEAE